MPLTVQRVSISFPLLMVVLRYVVLAVPHERPRLKVLLSVSIVQPLNTYPFLSVDVLAAVMVQSPEVSVAERLLLSSVTPLKYALPLPQM